MVSGYPVILDTPAGEPPVRKPAAEWARLKKPEAWKLAGAQQAGKWDAQWPILSEDEFDAAISATGEISIG